MKVPETVILPEDWQYQRFVDWSLEITPEEYARRVLHFIARSSERSIKESMVAANVYNFCTEEQAKYIEAVIKQMLQQEV